MARDCLSFGQPTGECPSTFLENLVDIIQDPEIRDVAGKILEVLSQRLEGEYMRIAEEDPQNPALRKIPGLARQARELRSYIQ